MVVEGGGGDDDGGSGGTVHVPVDVVMEDEREEVVVGVVQEVVQVVER